MRSFLILPRTMVLALLLSATALLPPSVDAQEKPAVKASKAQRDRLLTLDTHLRAAFGKSAASHLPEEKRKMPDASVASFDWIRMLGLTPVHKQSGKQNTRRYMAFLLRLESQRTSLAAASKKGYMNRADLERWAI